MAARNLSQIVDIIFVSDHGMKDTTDFRMVFLDDILGKDGMAEIEYEDGKPFERQHVEWIVTLCES